MNVPNDILLSIFIRTPWEDIMSLSLTDKRFSRLINNSESWIAKLSYITDEDYDYIKSWFNSLSGKYLYRAIEILAWYGIVTIGSENFLNIVYCDLEVCRHGTRKEILYFYNLDLKNYINAICLYFLSKRGFYDILIKYIQDIKIDLSQPVAFRRNYTEEGLVIAELIANNHAIEMAPYIVELSDIATNEILQRVGSPISSHVDNIGNIFYIINNPPNINYLTKLYNNNKSLAKLALFYYQITIPELDSTLTSKDLLDMNYNIAYFQLAPFIPQFCKLIQQTTGLADLETFVSSLAEQGQYYYDNLKYLVQYNPGQLMNVRLLFTGDIYCFQLIKPYLLKIVHIGNSYDIYTTTNWIFRYNSSNFYLDKVLESGDY